MTIEQKEQLDKWRQLAEYNRVVCRADEMSDALKQACDEIQSLRERIDDEQAEARWNDQ